MSNLKCQAKNPEACVDPNCPEKRGLDSLHGLNAKLDQIDRSSKVSVIPTVQQTVEANRTEFLTKLGLTEQQQEALNVYADQLQEEIFTYFNYANPEDIDLNYDVVKESARIVTDSIYEELPYVDDEDTLQLVEYIEANPKKWVKALTYGVGSSEEVYNQYLNSES